jgi:2,3-bisphosphoglycerate-dependent phosphoglycerate mutase
MEAPVITRQRRPFLAPLWVMALSGLAVITLLVAGYRSLATTTVVLVRHAEKELSTIDDPPLAQEGELRAARLSQMFGKPGGAGRVQAIYISDTRRSRMTAAPLAARLRVDPVVVPGNDVGGLARRVMRDHRGEAVLVVGYSNTLPEIIERISGLEVPPIGDDEYDLIYVVSVPTLGKASVLRLEY